MPGRRQADLLAADLDHILAHTRDLWNELHGRRIFITGGTGFFGCWLLESLFAANDRLNLGISAVVLTRSPQAFRQKAPRLAANSAIRLLAGDVRTFEFPDGEFNYVVHAATDASVKQAIAAPLEMFTTTVEGTRRVLEFAKQSNAKKFLLTSSGAVYGSQPSGITHISEEYSGGPDPTSPLSVYGEGKRSAEMLCSLYSSLYGIECKIARCFAFVGSHLPLDAHFAIGNFIRDVFSGNPIRVQGDGTAYRSYLYAADLAIWLWTILFKGISCRPYNVGSEYDLSIAELACRVAGCLNPAVPVQIAAVPVSGRMAARYVPSTKRAQHELGLRECFTLDESIRRTAEWYGWPGMHKDAAFGERQHAQ